MVGLQPCARPGPWLEDLSCKQHSVHANEACCCFHFLSCKVLLCKTSYYTVHLQNDCCYTESHNFYPDLYHYERFPKLLSHQSVPYRHGGPIMMDVLPPTDQTSLVDFLCMVSHTLFWHQGLLSPLETNLLSWTTWHIGHFPVDCGSMCCGLFYGFFIFRSFDTPSLSPKPSFSFFQSI